MSDYDIVRAGLGALYATYPEAKTSYALAALDRIEARERELREAALTAWKNYALAGVSAGQHQLDMENLAAALKPFEEER